VNNNSTIEFFNYLIVIFVESSNGLLAERIFGRAFGIYSLDISVNRFSYDYIYRIELITFFREPQSCHSNISHSIVLQQRLLDTCGDLLCFIFIKMHAKVQNSSSKAPIE
jgi:hypothetical protein